MNILSSRYFNSELIFIQALILRTTMTPTHPRQQEDANYGAAILLHTLTPAPALLLLQHITHSHLPPVRI